MWAAKQRKGETKIDDIKDKRLANKQKKSNKETL